MHALRGLSAFPVTPADPDGVVDTDHLQRLVARLAAAGVSSIGVLGSTGSYMYLSSSERARALCAAVEAAGDVPVIAGIGALRTSEVLRHTRDAATAGVRGLLLAPVTYVPLTQADFNGLVEDIARTSDLPICLYNNFGKSSFEITHTLTAKLSQIETVQAVKNPAPAQDTAAEIAALRAMMPGEFVLGYSGDALINGPLGAGADAWYSVIAGALPDLAVAIWQARDDGAELQRLHSRAAPLWQLFDEFGGIRVVPEILNILGLGPVALPKPLLPLSAPAITRIETVLDALDTCKMQTQLPTIERRAD